MDLPEIRPDACDPAVRRVVVDLHDIDLMAATLRGRVRVTRHRGDHDPEGVTDIGIWSSPTGIRP